MRSCLVCDDHALMREALCGQIALAWPEAQLHAASDFEQAWALAAAKRPDLVLCDLAMPGADPAAGVAGVIEAAPGARIVVVTGGEDDVLLIALFELVHIKAPADARGAGGGEQAGQHVEILGVGDLGKADGAGNELDPRPRRFNSGQVVNEVRACGFEGRADGAEAEGLGRLDTEQGAPVDGGERIAALMLQRVRNGQGWGGGVVRFEGGDQGRDRCIINPGPGRIVNENDGVIGSLQRFQPAEHRLGAGCAWFGAGETLAGAGRAKVRSGDNHDVRDGGMAAESIDGPVHDAPPQQYLPLLGLVRSGPVSLASGDDNGGCATHRGASSGAGRVWPYCRSWLACCTKIVLPANCALANKAKVVKKE